MAGQNELGELLHRFREVLSDDEKFRFWGERRIVPLTGFRMAFFRRIKDDPKAKDYMEALENLLKANDSCTTHTWKSQDKHMALAHAALDRLGVPRP